MRLPRRVPAFWIGAALCLVVRVLMAMSRADEYRGEELYIGSLAWALIEGMPLDAEALPVIPHLRGSVVFALILAPIFKFTGPALLGLKILAVAWSAVCAGLFAFILERRAGRAAGLAGAGLYALLPPSFQMVDVLALGSHGDVLLPILAALALLLCCEGPRGWRWSLSFGAICGFGCFFSMQFLVVLAPLLLVWVVVDPGFWRRLPTLGALLAAAPMVALIGVVSGKASLVNKPIESHLLPDGISGAGMKLGALLSSDLRRSWLFEDSGGAWLGWVLLLCGLASLPPLLRRARRRDPLALFCLSYPALLMGAFCLSDFKINFTVTGPGMGSRYFMPILPFLAAWPALAFVEHRSRGSGRLGGLLLASALAAGAGGVFALMAPTRPWSRPPVRGTNLVYFSHLDHAAGGQVRGQIEWGRRVEPGWEAYRPLSFAHLDGALLTLAPGEPFDEQFLRRIGRLDPTMRQHALARMGYGLGGAANRSMLAQTLETLPSDLPDADWLARGIGRAAMSRLLARLVRTRGHEGVGFGMLAGMPQSVRAEALLGAGFHLGLLFTPYQDLYPPFVAKAGSLPPEQRSMFFRGLALGYRLRFRESSYAAPGEGKTALERAVPAADRPSFRAGLELEADRW